MHQAHAGYYAPTPAVGQAAGGESAIDERKAALFDMAYLIVSFSLYLYSFVLPFLGVIVVRAPACNP